MIVFPNAKINFGLRITAKRPDGFHDIESIFFPVNLHDALEFVIPEGKPESDILNVSGFDTGSSSEDNLVIKTATKLHSGYDLPKFRIHLHKAIPAGAGLGGGSSDAAWFLKAVNRQFLLGIADSELKDTALSLGSDCPFFLENIPAIATGRGEQLKPAGNFLQRYYLVLLNPGLHISTKEAYSNCIPSKPSESLEDLVKLPVNEWKNHIMNDFESFAFGKYALIGDLKSGLYKAGALFSLMSGSGSSVFGIFTEKKRLPDNLRKYLIYEGFL